MPKLTKQKEKKMKPTMAYMLQNSESFPCEVYFTKKGATEAKKDWERNWDEYYKIIKVKITQL